MRSLLLLSLLACSDPSPRAVPFEQYAESARSAYCAWADRCHHVPDEATCRRLLDPKLYDLRRASDGIRLGRLVYDPAAAGRCLAAARAAACSAPAFVDESCSGVFVGQVPEGKTCTTAFDCASHALCLEALCRRGCCVGTCGPPRTPEPAPDLAEVGEPCRSHSDCVYTAYCDFGLCVALPNQPGQRCQLGCATGDLYCDVETEICRTHPAIGAPCGPDAHCNPYFAFCDGVCKPRPGPGEACDDARLCIPSAICQADAGVCAPRGDPGAPCTRDQDCEYACDLATGLCAAYETCGL